MQDTVPGSSGFYMPAEWERHEGTWLHWPQEKLYRGYELKLERMWLSIVDVLHQHENVHLVVADEWQRDHVVSLLEYFAIGLENIDFHLIPTDDIWARDNGPIFVTEKSSALTRLVSSKMAGESPVSPSPNPCQ